MGTNGNCWPVNMRSASYMPGMWLICQNNSASSSEFLVQVYKDTTSYYSNFNTGKRRFNIIHVTIVGNIETNTTKIYLNGVEQELASRRK